MIYQLLVRIISYEYLLIYSTVATAYSTHDASVPLCGRGRWCQVVGASMVYFRARSVRRTFRTANDRAPRAFLSESTYTSIHRFNSIDERSIRYMLTPRRTCRLANPGQATTAPATTRLRVHVGRSVRSCATNLKAALAV
jgi:hypothetical protein